MEATLTPVLSSGLDITPGWLSRALSTEVRTARVESVGTGKTSATYRVTLDADSAPPTLIAKLAEGSHEDRLRVRTAHHNEVGFYREVATRLPVRLARCHYAALSEDASGFTLLLEDLAPRRPGSQTEECPPARVEAAVGTLARIHGSTWNDASLANLGFHVPLTEARAEFLTTLTTSATDLFVTRYHDHLDDDDIATLRQVTEVLLQWQTAPTRPFCLVHGDFRLDNLLFGSDDAVPVDWQTVTIGRPSRDLAYFLASSVPVDTRRAIEEAQVDLYHQELLRSGVSGYSLEQCRSDYRTGPLHGAMTTVLGSMTSTGPRDSAGDDMFLSMAQRSCAAIRDLGSIEMASRM